MVQPGPPAAERIVAVPARGRSFSARLPAGERLLDAAHAAFAREGFAGGVIEIGEMALGPFAYVMPALSKTPDHAAFYSDMRRPAGVTRLSAGAMTLGRRDGAPFFHCHALWREADGALSGGHILPEETRLAEAAEVACFGLDGAMFQADPDPETNFKLFGPVPAPPLGARADREAWVLRLRPNQDFAGALEQFCVARGLGRVRVRGGVGSTIGASFDDAGTVENFATEVFVRGGAVLAGAASLDVGLVDFAGARACGRLRRGDNPVLMTFELALEVMPEA
ncbi:MAG: DUF296 domain-containing protein [Rhizobiales bacterium]|nr:DUF296 domain-containing protein [Hyphomicrobiales bacterium]